MNRLDVERNNLKIPLAGKGLRERDLLSGDSTALAILFSQLYIYYL